MRLVFMGSPDFSVPCLEGLLAAGHEIVALYCQPPRPSGRGERVRKTPVQERAERLGIACHTPLDFSDPREVAKLRAFGAELAVVVAYGIILPQSVLSAFERGCVNLHASLLPRWRGAAPIQRAIMAGDTVSGVCVMQMEAGLDRGAVLARHAVAIGQGESAGALSERLSHRGAELLVETLAKLGTLIPEAQDDQAATYAHKIQKSEARINWARTAVEIERQIYGLSPQPGAWFEAEGRRYKLLSGRKVDVAAKAGQVLPDLVIGCAKGAIKVACIQPQGKGRMTAEAFLNGYSLPAWVM